MAISLIRTLILYLLTMLAVRCMGKRQIGELEPMELVVTLLISDLATVSMQDLESPMVHSVVPIATLVILEIFTAALALRFPRFHRMLSGRYAVLIDDGVINQKEMRRTQITVGELMEELRQNGLMAVEDVKYCVMETGGKISVIPKKDATQPKLPVILISDGDPVEENLRLKGLDRKRLGRIVSGQGAADVKEVFLLYEIDGEYTCIRKESGR